jgi:hypothetical protein
MVTFWATFSQTHLVTLIPWHIRNEKLGQVSQSYANRRRLNTNKVSK